MTTLNPTTTQFPIQTTSSISCPPGKILNFYKTFCIENYEDSKTTYDKNFRTKITSILYRW